MSKLPAVAACIAVSSTLFVLLASLAAAGAFVSGRSGTSPTGPADDRLSSDGNPPGTDAAASALVCGSFDLRPEVLNLDSSGRYVTGMLALPDGRSVRDVFIPSVRLNGVVYASTSFGPHNPVVQFENKETLMLKFEKDSVTEILTPGEMVPIWVTGSFTDGTCFIASGQADVVAR